MYYLYRHIRLDKNVPFYIGIGTKRTDSACHEVEYERAYYKKGRNKTWQSIAQRAGYKVQILFESPDREEINQKEKEFIKLYGRITDHKGPLANYTDGGDSCTMAIEIKEKLSKIHKEKYLRGYINPKTGIKESIEVIKKRSIPVVQYDLGGNKLGEFYSLAQAARETNSDFRLIHKVCKGLRTKHNGFAWKYENDRGQQPKKRYQ